MKRSRKKSGMLLLALSFGAFGALVACETPKESNHEKTKTQEETFHRVEDNSLIQKELEKEGNEVLTATQQHRYFMEGIDGLIKDAIEKRSMTPDERAQYVHKIEKELVYLSNVPVPKELKKEYDVWTERKEQLLNEIRIK